MEGIPDPQLLREYAERRSQTAFAELVRRHVDLVFSVARRLLVDPHLAEDVTQNVFVVLAREAGTVAAKVESGVPLSAWLHTTTRNQAVTVVRTEQRRREREQKAVDMQNSPTSNPEPPWDRVAELLDPALASLGEQDRHAILLRYFERKSAREIGERFGWSEEAAQKRVSRALDRLREVLVDRGLAVRSASLAGGLAVRAVEAAPAGLAATVTAGVASAVWVPAAGTASGSFLIMTNLTKLVVASLALAAVTGVVLLQHREIGRLADELASARAALVVRVPAAGTNPVPTTSAPSEELLRLRGEVASLRRLAGEVEALRRENARLAAAKAGPEASPPATLDQVLEEDRQKGIARLNYMKDWGLAVWKYAAVHGDQMPARLEDAQPHLELEDDPGWLKPEQFELLYRGSLRTLSDPSRTIIVREREPFPSVNPERPGWKRTYLFADGHAEILYRADGNFEDWERERTAAPQQAGP